MATVSRSVSMRFQRNRPEAEMPAAYPAEAFAERAGAPCEVRILPDCDHFYTGREADVANQVALWLKQTCKLDQS